MAWREWDTEDTGDLDESWEWQPPHRDPYLGDETTPAQAPQEAVLSGRDPVVRQWPSATYPDNWDIYADEPKKR